MKPTTKSTWTVTARKSLVFQKAELLDEARAEARGQREIIAFLEAFVFLLAAADGDTSEIDRLADRLIPQLNSENRREEALTVNLLYLDTRVSLLRDFALFPISEQKRTRDLGIKACGQAIQIAKTLGDEACEAFYTARLADCFRYSRLPLEAEYLYERALTIYRELARREPENFVSKLALTVSCLGVVKIELQKLSEAEKILVEAVRLYTDLASRQPQIFMEKLEIARGNLGVVRRELNASEEREN